MNRSVLYFVSMIIVCAAVFAGCFGSESTPGESESTPMRPTEGAAGSEDAGAIAVKPKLSIERDTFGKTTAGEVVEVFRLKSESGMAAEIIEFGGILHSLKVPDKDGELVDVLLGCETIACYNENSPYFGATTGRYANRIADGKFTLDGKEYTLATNNEPNHLHGGNIGFDKVLWEGKTFQGNGYVGVYLKYVSPDGDEGYPGTLTNSVFYKLTDANELEVSFESITDKATVINLTNHAYYNLGGHDSGTILDHELMIAASQYTPTDETFITTGAIEPVAGTPLDFSSIKPIGQDIAQIPGDPGGYDHNFVLDHNGESLALAARVKDPESGRVMEIWNDEPGLQFYTGNFLDGSFEGKGGAVYEKNNGFCLESQKFPDSPNHPNFPSPVLRPGEVYSHTIIMKFSAE